MPCVQWGLTLRQTCAGFQPVSGLDELAGAFQGPKHGPFRWRGLVLCWPASRTSRLPRSPLAHVPSLRLSPQWPRLTWHEFCIGTRFEQKLPVWYLGEHLPVCVDNTDPARPKSDSAVAPFCVEAERGEAVGGGGGLVFNKH